MQVIDLNVDVKEEWPKDNVQLPPEVVKAFRESIAGFGHGGKSMAYVAALMLFFEQPPDVRKAYVTAASSAKLVGEFSQLLEEARDGRLKKRVKAIMAETPQKIYSTGKPPKIKKTA